MINRGKTADIKSSSSETLINQYIHIQHLTSHAVRDGGNNPATDSNRRTDIRSTDVSRALLITKAKATQQTHPSRPQSIV